MTTEKRHVNRTQSDRWTEHVAGLEPTAEAWQAFAEVRQAALFWFAGPPMFLALRYRDGSITVHFAGLTAAVVPLFDSEAELLTRRREWLSDLYALLAGNEPAYNGEAETGWRLYVEELHTLASAWRELEPAVEDEEDAARPPGDAPTDEPVSKGRAKKKS